MSEPDAKLGIYRQIFFYARNICLWKGELFTSLAIFIWFIHDAYELFEKIAMFKKNISLSDLKLFGTAILLWPLYALLRVKIKLVKEEQISLNLFVDTAITSTVRSFLVSTEERKSLRKTYYLICINSVCNSKINKLVQRKFQHLIQEIRDNNGRV